MNIYKVRIYENHGSGLKLEDLERKLLKYIDRKKSSNQTHINGNVSYVLRNGLHVNLYSRNGIGILEMLVAGDIRTFAKSIEAIMKIYKGHIEISYLQ